jgi:septation ring formation regulator EzrA
MKKAYKIIALTIFAVLMPNGIYGAERRAEPPERDQPPVQAIARRQQAQPIEVMRNRLAELRQEVRNAERENHPEEARDLREKVAQLVEQIQSRTQRMTQRRLREVDEYIDRLRQITREAEEIRERIRVEIEQRDRAWMEPGRESPLRPRVQKRIENIHNVIGQVRETFMKQMERIEAAFGGLRDNIEQMEGQIQELRAENERLRNRLREQEEQRRPREREVPERRNPERPRDGGEFTVP